jgi:membrane fusion protein (multidrug efflux system)
MNRRAIWIFAAAIALPLAIAAGGCGDSPVASAPNPAPAAAPPTSPDAARPAIPAPPAKSATANDILSVLSVEHQVDVSTQLDGVVVSVAKDEGSVVKAGDILGQLDDRTLQMELVKARDDLQVSQNNVKYKEAELKAKGAALHRQQQLHDLGLSTQADLDGAEFEAKAAEYDMHGWEALVESGNAQIRQFDIQIDQTRLRAPFPGVVVRRYIREGQTIAKQEKCFRVSQLSPLQVQFQVPETSGRRPERGAMVDLSPIGDAKRALHARVVKVSPIVDPSSDSYDVTAQLAGPGIADLRPGMAVRVDWLGTEHPHQP